MLEGTDFPSVLFYYTLHAWKFMKTLNFPLLRVVFSLTFFGFWGEYYKKEKKQDIKSFFI